MASYQIPQLTEDIYDPFTAYLQRLGLGTQNYFNPAQQYQIGQFDPLQNMYNIRGRMATLPGNQGMAPGYFSDWMNQFTPNPNQGGGMNSYYGTMYPQAQNLMRQIFNTGQEGRAQAGTVYEPTYSGGERTGSGNIAELQQLIQTALRGQLGRPGANWLAGNLPAEQQRWAGQQVAQGPQGTFLDYIRSKYNLGGLGY